MKLRPNLIKGGEGIEKPAHLVRAHFRADGHRVQFNVRRADALWDAQPALTSHLDLVVRVAGYRDSFCDLPVWLQDEIVCTEHESLSRATADRAPCQRALGHALGPPHRATRK